MSEGGIYEADLRTSLDAVLREASAYFVREGRLHQSLRRLVSRLQAEEIVYALVGSLALGEHGYVRMTEDIDVLLTPAGLERFRERLLGRNLGVWKADCLRFAVARKLTADQEFDAYP